MDRRDKSVFGADQLKLFLGIIIIIILGLSLFFQYYNKATTKKNKELDEQLLTAYNHYVETAANYADLSKRYSRYSAIDDSLNSIRKEYQSYQKQLEDLVVNKKINKKIAYVSFDDGPYELTYKVLKTLKKHNVRVTFFVIGEKRGYLTNKKRDDLYQREFYDGHIIANHTYSHAINNGLYKSVDSYIDSSMKLDEHIYKLTGYKMSLWRFPGGPLAVTLRLGNTNYKKIIKEMIKNGYSGHVYWTAADGDGSNPGLTTDITYNNFVKSINERIEVVLFHDYSNSTYKILDKALDYLDSKGYIIMPLFDESRVVKKE